MEAMRSGWSGRARRCVRDCPRPSIPVGRPPPVDPAHRSSVRDTMRRILASTGAAALLLGLSAVGLKADDEPQPQAKPKADAAPKAESANNLDIDALLNRSRTGPEHGSTLPEKKYRDFAEGTRGSEKIDGLFTLHKKDDHLYAEIKPYQFDQPMLLPVTIARGLAQAGMPVGDGEMVLVFRKVGDKVQVVRRNIRYRAPDRTPL